MPVHRRMPVVAPVERRSQFAGRMRIRIAVQDVRDLVRVFAMQARECQLGKVRGAGDVERLGKRYGGFRFARFETTW